MDVRWMIRRDMPEVLDIEKDNDRGWVETDFLRALKQRNCIGMVCESKPSRHNWARILGFMIYELFKDRVEVIKFAVHPNERRKGVGKALCDKLKSKLSSHRRVRLVIEVPDNALDAHLFFKAQGFEATRIVPGDDYDLYRMVYRESVLAK